MIRAIVFDFNGTMFMDTDKHRASWEELFLHEHGPRVDDAEFRAYMCGPPNGDIIRRYLGADLSDERVAQMAEEKERVYRRLCLEDEEHLRLVEGLDALLDRLAAARVPMTIATGAGADNLAFYFEVFNLDRWFARNKVVYSDGMLPGKPHPQVYLRAFELLGVPARDCMVVEDAFSGIQAARAAGAGQIVAIATYNAPEVLARQEGVTCVIDDFRGFERHTGFALPVQSTL